MNWAQYPTQRTTTRTQQTTWRNTILARDPHCKANGPRCTHIATEADHITNIADGGNELDPANGQGLCHNCHNDKTQAEAKTARSKWKRKPERHPGLKQQGA